MILTPFDIASYLYCPFLLEAKHQAKEIITPSLSPYEECLRQTIIRTEELCLLKDTEITPRKLLRVWDAIWWPIVGTLGLSIKESQMKSIEASSKLSDYCKYDISDIEYKTASTNIEAKKIVGSSILCATADIVKVDVSAKARNMVIIDLSRKDLTDLDVTIDPVIRATAYAFYTGKKETITYISVDVSGGGSKLKVKVSFFRPEELEDIAKSIKLAEQGIRTNTIYANPWKCKECNVCNSKSLMRKGIRSK
jgi:CRISPR/Cas system-associated exonuclease Cas4 (RecB family)